MKTELLDDEIYFSINENDSSHEYALLKYRLVALFIDSAVLFFFSYIVGSFILFNSIWTFLSFITIVLYLYFIIQEISVLGGTIGKYLIKLSIYTDQLNKIKLIHTFKRTTFKILLIWLYVIFDTFPMPFHAILMKYSIDVSSSSFFIKIILFIATIVYFLYTILSIYKSRKQQSWYDKIAGTIVLRELKKPSEIENN